MPDVTDLDVQPRPAVLEMVAPSQLNRLLECPRRLAYGRDVETRDWQRPSTRTALGVVAHGLVEAWESAPAPVDDAAHLTWLRATWDDLVHTQVERLQEAWPGRAVPAPTTWPGYAVTKVRLIRSLARRGLPEGAAPDGPGPGQAPGGVVPFPWVERKLQDAATGLFGTPDRVDEVAGRLRVVDLKSGVGQTAMTEAQKRQLLVYAWLVQCTSGRLPDDLVVLDARGHEEVSAVLPTEVAAVVKQAQDAVAAFNDQVARGSVPGKPAPDTCRWCEFRVVCGDYWSARGDGEWATNDAAGRVTEVRGEEVLLEPAAAAGAIPSRLLLAGDDVPAAGDLVVATDLEVAGYDTARMRWSSRLRVVTSSRQ